MFVFCRWALLSLLMAITSANAADTIKVDPMDWTFVRGPERNGISHEVGLPDKWSPAGENLIWTSTECAGKSTPIVMNGKFYTLSRHKPGTSEEAEKVICVDAATGKKIWENIFNVFLSDVPDTRIGWSSVVGDPTTGRVYALGVCGYFQCLDGETGKTIWSHSMSEEFGLLTTYGGRTNFPFVFEDLVIISGVMTGWGEAARPNHRFIAFNKATGESVWFNSTRPLPDDTTFSTPILGSFNGQLLFVVACGDGALYAIQPRTGKIAWKHQLSRRGANGTPLIDGNKIYITQAEENPEDTTMGSVTCIDGTTKGELPPKPPAAPAAAAPAKPPAGTPAKPPTGPPAGPPPGPPIPEIPLNKVVWRAKEVLAGRNQPLLIDGRLYVVDDGAGIFIYDAATGNRINKKPQKLGTVMRGSLLAVDGKIYACEANGRCWILKPSDKGLDVVHKIQLQGEQEGSPAEIQASPIVSHGRIYITTTDATYCIGKKDVTPKLTQEPVPLKEAELAKDSKPAQIQIVPVESLIEPSQKIKFTTQVFNAIGQRLDAKGQAPTYAVDAYGAVSASGEFTPDPKAAHKGSIVTAKLGELKSMGRVRIVPPLPWKFDFSDNEVPITWIGARYRHVPRDVKGEKLIVKITTIPKGTRSQSWMGPVTHHDYTIQADVLGKSLDGKMPDIGLIAQRYTLDLMGQNQTVGEPAVASAESASTDAKTETKAKEESADEKGVEEPPKQQLQVRTWPPMIDRKDTSKTIDFQWKPEVWYTIKFRAANDGDKAVLKGKVWERDKPEPAEWTIEFEDMAPNKTGSPGLYGNATNGEIFLDNITVTPNK